MYIYELHENSLQLYSHMDYYLTFSSVKMLCFRRIWNMITSYKPTGKSIFSKFDDYILFLIQRDLWQLTPEAIL